MIRAAVRRDGPGEWSWALQDAHGDIVVGLADSWSAALAEATDELRLLDEINQPPGCEIPIVGPRFHELNQLRITPGDAAVPAGDRHYDGRAPWRRWLGL